MYLKRYKEQDSKTVGMFTLKLAPSSIEILNHYYRSRTWSQKQILKTTQISNINLINAKNVPHKTSDFTAFKQVQDVYGYSFYSTINIALMNNGELGLSCTWVGAYRDRALTRGVHQTLGRHKDLSNIYF